MAYRGCSESFVPPHSEPVTTPTLSPYRCNREMRLGLPRIEDKERQRDVWVRGGRYRVYFVATENLDDNTKIDFLPVCGHLCVDPMRNQPECVCDLQAEWDSATSTPGTTRHSTILDFQDVLDGQKTMATTTTEVAEHKRGECKNKETQSRVCHFTCIEVLAAVPALAEAFTPPPDAMNYPLNYPQSKFPYDPFDAICPDWPC